jgi:hypothetical protein
MLSVNMLCHCPESHNSECHYAEGRGAIKMTLQHNGSESAIDRALDGSTNTN